jgi:hypothetical protein
MPSAENQESRAELSSRIDRIVAAALTALLLVYLFKLFVFLRSPHIPAASLTWSRVALAAYLLDLILVAYLFRTRRLRGILSPQSFRVYLILFVAWVILFHLAFSSTELARKAVQHLCLSLFLLVGLLAARFRDRVGTTPARRILEFILFQAALFVVLMEIALAVWMHFSDSPLALDQGNPQKTLQTYRLKPGTKLYGFPANSLGYYDTEFTARGPSRFVVNSIADSFGICPVPLTSNFLFVAEQLLRAHIPGRDVFINNFGVPATGLPEYVELYRKETAAFPSDVTMVCIFVGNDIEFLRKYRVESIWSFSNWRVYRVTGRILALLRERQISRIGQQPRNAKPETAGPAATAGTDESVPSMSEERFLKIEKDRMRQVCTRHNSSDENYEAFFTWIKYLKDQVHEKFLLVVIPDEFQVNDALYGGLLADYPYAVDRFLPQRRIADFCRRQHIRCLDLLPVLRNGERGGRCYHPRDTHWNSRGNRLAGEAIASELAGMMTE